MIRTADVRWICPAGHEVAAMPSRRVRHINSPACRRCSGLEAVPGVTDVGTKHPLIVAFWDHALNARPYWTRVSGTPDSASWRCRCGYRWKQSIKTFADRPRCPKCHASRRRRVNVRERIPQYAPWWDSAGNRGLNPAEVDARDDKVRWICPFGHPFEATVRQMIERKHPCVVCTGRRVIPGVNDLMTAYPEIARQFSEARNWPLTASQVSPGSTHKRWWECPDDRHEDYEAVVSKRTREGTGCPRCSGRLPVSGLTDLATVRPDVAARWHPTLNGHLTPSDVAAFSRREVFFQCPCGQPQHYAVHLMKADRLCRSCAAKRRCALRQRLQKSDAGSL